MIETINATSQATGELAVSEVFGPTWQGEGPSLGRRCAFLRLAGCNQHCHWCDTAYTWAYSEQLAEVHDDKKRYSPKDEVHRLSDAEIVNQLLAVGVDMLVISGGEPLLQRSRLERLLGREAFAGWRIEIETAGTVAPTPLLIELVDQFNVSPKLESSGNDLKLRYHTEVLKCLQKTKKAVWKFVVSSDYSYQDDFDEISHIVKECGLYPVYIMPEGRTASELLIRTRQIAPYVHRYKWNLTTRLHVLAYGNMRGV